MIDLLNLNRYPDPYAMSPIRIYCPFPITNEFLRPFGLVTQNFLKALSHLLLHFKGPLCLLLAQESLHDSCRGAIAAAIVRLYAGGQSNDTSGVDSLALHDFN